MKGTIETYRENILKEGTRRLLYYSKPARIVYDDLSNYIYNKKFKKASKDFKKLHNKHLGDRCFIVATGPSLNKTNLNLLNDEVTIGINTSFKTGIKFNYFIVSDRIIWDVYSEELLNLNSELILGYVASRHFFRDKMDGAYVIRGKNTSKLPKSFPKDIEKDVYVHAHTVVYIALQILYYLGFSKVYLVGCDCDYSRGYFNGKHFAETSKLQEIESEEMKFWNTIFDAYKVCKEVYEKSGRKIYNSTVGGKLEVFERKTLEEVLNEQ